MTYEQFMVAVFWWCVNLLDDTADTLGITYEELNIYVFIIAHPAVTLGLLVWALVERRRGTT